MNKTSFAFAVRLPLCWSALAIDRATPVGPAVRRLQDKLSQRYAACRSEVDLIRVLHCPPGRRQLPVDLDAGTGLGCQV